MARAVTVRPKGVVARYAEALGRLQTPGDYVLVERGMPRSIVMSCPDGCGDPVTVNLDRRSGPAWRRYETGGALTLYPSVWRDTGCRSHFIVFRDSILWCGLRAPTLAVDVALIDAAHAELGCSSVKHFEAIADSLGALPWEAYWACLTLVLRGRAYQTEPGWFIGARD